MIYERSKPNCSLMRLGKKIDSGIILTWEIEECGQKVSFKYL